MITGKIKNQVDAIWMSFWTGGITNSIDVLERERVVYDAPEVILGRVVKLQNEINEALLEFRAKYMK
jgi:hypothetical protein